MGKLEGKVAVITGGATGIGLAAAKRFIEEGAFVFIFGRRQQALDAAIADLGPNARAVKGSVSDEADLDRLYAAVKAERGTLDIVFANAGVGSQLKLGEITAKHIDEIFDVNVKGTTAPREPARARGFRILEGGELSICCARFEAEGRSEPEIDALQARIASEVAASGEAWFSTVIHAGRTWLRFNLVNLHTREEHIHRLADLVNRTARAISLREGGSQLHDIAV